MPGTLNAECRESACARMSCAWDLKCGISGECMCEYVVCLGLEVWNVERAGVSACRVPGT